LIQSAAAQQGQPGAYANLGILYMNGWGVRRDYAEAFKYLQLAANAGDAGAQSNLGYLYDGGLGVVQDYSAAVKWYRLAEYLPALQARPAKAGPGHPAGVFTGTTKRK
jgi:TPR repeat protein